MFQMKNFKNNLKNLLIRISLISTKWRQARKFMTMIQEQWLFHNFLNIERYTTRVDPRKIKINRRKTLFFSYPPPGATFRPGAPIPFSPPSSNALFPSPSTTSSHGIRLQCDCRESTGCEHSGQSAAQGSTGTSPASPQCTFLRCDRKLTSPSPYLAQCTERRWCWILEEFQLWTTEPCGLLWWSLASSSSPRQERLQRQPWSVWHVGASQACHW